jgi:hypothetical protein
MPAMRRAGMTASYKKTVISHKEMPLALNIRISAIVGGKRIMPAAD